MSRAAFLKKRDQLVRGLVWRTRVMTLLLAADLAFILAGWGLNLFDTGRHQAAMTGRVLSSGAFSQGMGFLLGPATMAFNVCLVFFFCIWIHQAYRLYKWRGDARYDHSPFWAVAYFFVPFVNWWMPPLVVSEMWRGTDPRQTDPKQARNGLVVWWWLAYVPLPLVATYAHNRAAAAQTLPQVQASLWTLIAVDLWHVVAAVLALVLVRRLTRRMVYFGPRSLHWPTVDEVLADLERAYRLPKTVLSVDAFSGRRKYGG